MFQITTIRSAVVLSLVVSSIGVLPLQAIAHIKSPTNGASCQPSTKHSGKAKKMLPFNGSIAIVNPTQTIVIDSAGNLTIIVESATGFSNLTGKLNAKFAFQPLSQTKYNGTIEIIDAKKKQDKINLSFTGAEIQPPVNGKFPIAFPAKITCGTGRFAQATGEIFFNGTIELEATGGFGPTFFDFTGAILKPKKH